MFAARGDIAQFQHREVRWEGLIIFSRQIITVFWQKRGIRSCHLSFVWTGSTSLVWNLNAYLFLVYIDNMYGLHLKGQTQILSQNWNWFNMCSHGFIPKRVMAWQYFSFAKKTDPWYICTMNPREYILEPHYLFSYHSIF